MARKSRNRRFSGSFAAVLAAALLGCALADLGFVVARAPGLLAPAHWNGLMHLALSSLILYAAAGVLASAYVLVLYGFVRLFRYRPRGDAAALVMIASFPLFLVMLKAVQSAMLGTYASLRSPLFLAPIAIAVFILCAAAGIVVACAKPFSRFPGPRSGRFRFVAYAGACAIAFIAAAAIFGQPVNVLGVFGSGEERAVHRESILPAVSPARSGAPNFIVLMIECLRPDHFAHETAPFLRRLAEDNVYFSRHYVAAPATRPSVTSFFTSRYPVQHNCYNLAGGRTSSGAVMRRRIPEDAKAFPRLLQENGYRTLMVTSNGMVMDPSFGFERIFNRFDAELPYRFRVPFPEPFLGFRFLRSTLAHFRVLNMILFSPEHSTTYFDAPRLNKTIERELPGLRGSPFFMYVHYIEPHSPYYSHPYKPVQLNIYLPSQRGAILRHYRSEIGAVDAAIGDLYRRLESLGLLDNTYLLITADHGEEFYDHGDWGHGKSVYPEVLHVPAILVAPPAVRRALKIDRPVDNVDFCPTIAELAHIPVQEGWEGESLVPLMNLEGSGGDSGEGAAEERSSEQLPGAPAPVLSQFDDGHAFYASAIMDSFQIILRAQGEKERFFIFNLEDDPLAAKNLFGADHAMEDSLVIYLERTLQRLRDRSGGETGSEESVDEDLLEQLKTLGYIE